MHNVADGIIRDIIKRAREDKHPISYIRGSIDLLKDSKLDTTILITKVEECLHINPEKFEQ